MRFAPLAAVALLLAPLAASAADLPVSYTVDEKALKLAIAGTNVTFDLYTDSACTGAIDYTETVAIENVDIISRLKLGVPKGALVKPPKTDELRQTLTGVTASGNLYLKVTGTGVTPVGGACQPQTGQATGTIPAHILTLQFGLTGAQRWGVENATTALPPLNDPAILVPMTAAVSAALTAAASTFGEVYGNRISCTFQTNPFHSFNSGTTAYVPAFAADGCTPLPNCIDGIQNNTETDIDCGGALCPGGCPAGKHCLVGSDCGSYNCSGSVCQP